MKLKFVSSHWDSFYSFEEVETLYQSGISHVRIPVGYWIVDTEPGIVLHFFHLILLGVVKRGQSIWDAISYVEYLLAQPIIGH